MTNAIRFWQAPKASAGCLAVILLSAPIVLAANPAIAANGVKNAASYSNPALPNMPVSILQALPVSAMVSSVSVGGLGLSIGNPGQSSLPS